MGNTESNVTSGVKKQTDTSSITMYKLVDLKGGGLLVELMKRATQNKQYAELDHAIKTKVEPFLYNKGNGRLISIAKLVLLRNKDRPRTKMLPPLKNMENPDDFDVIGSNIPGIPEPKETDDPSTYRDVCWDLNERGAVGETILHLCLLNATSVHADLAKRLLKFYPKLINDIYMCDEYYGESVLHIAIVNEDPGMVKFLLNSGADFHERCFGNFMCPEDQKASRSDSFDHEWVNLWPVTNYEGYVYWGEYPLSFAACLGQEECYRLMLARGANPDNQDTNGNTVLHMLVIYEKMGTFDTAYELGANVSVRNIQNLTPLTLAAKLARIEMFFHIMNIEREIYWQIGSITCAAYPLMLIDTIDIETGNISKDSALNLVVFGDKDEHLDLMEGVLVDLLHAKWNAFVKFRFYRQFIMFFQYFLISCVCFILRPGPPEAHDGMNITANATLNLSFGVLEVRPEALQALLYRLEKLSLPQSGDLERFILESLADEKSISEAALENDENREPGWNNSVFSTYETLARDTGYQTDESPHDGLSSSMDYAEVAERLTKLMIDVNLTERSGAVNEIILKALPSLEEKEDGLEEWWSGIAGDCILLQVNDLYDLARLCAEVALEIGAFLYLLAALREARFLGLKMMIENLMTAPSRVMFLFSCCLMMTMPFFRFTCQDETEDILAVVIMLTTGPYFLFFCRGFKTVGPFVVMIYRMVMGDLLRFASIYLVFVMGFSQAYYIIFLTYDNPTTPEGTDDTTSNPLPSPIEAIMAMFFMSLTNFGDYYSAFENTEHEIEAKAFFVIYMVIVAILLINMLIAMMGNTYQKIAETKNEWQRQWARIVLVVERGVSPKERLKKLMSYSQPMSDGRRALVLRLNMTEEDKEEMKEILEMKRVHDKIVMKRKKGLKLLGTTTPSPKRMKGRETPI
ncbi:transient receptor potential cation channel subfamily V member 5 [Nilaparvata lugens]|uniref:TRP channel protein nanchung n=1 Tax=Nilaparvata lugens TaxID=108931 RepID=A0A2D3C346_NILLU|nr:transient receptor potential cation channel subfamily V member 5 [Nilaparvata lugens]ATU07272.1 TRP channel protein nanchung [Nilaparvata lugens]